MVRCLQDIPLNRSLKGGHCMRNRERIRCNLLVVQPVAFRNIPSQIQRLCDAFRGPLRNPNAAGGILCF